MVLSMKLLELRLYKYGVRRGQTRLPLKSIPNIRIYTSEHIMLW